MKKLFISIAIILTGILSGCISGEKNAKYVFYFIGDGMGEAQVNVAEYYKAHLNGKWGSMPMTFSTFPVMGSATTFSKSNLITDSAASGTALATGKKTKNGMIGLAPDSVTKYESIAYKIHDAGFRVGVSSTVGINHATPAAFYGHNIKRSNYYEIGLEMPETGFEFFGGGGILKYQGKKHDKPSLYDKVKEAGYLIVQGVDEFNEKKDQTDKIYMIQENGWDKDNCPYAIDKEEGDMTHADIVRAAVDFLYDKSGKQGFFLMSENGKIDWACHSNDLKTVMLEVMSLSDAVDVALEFYNQHPDETLIIVTADHETGGLALSYQKGYHLYPAELDKIDHSKDFLDDPKEHLKIDEATKNAKFGWSTTSHSAANVPVFAIGAGSGLFSGTMDNTEIPMKICKAMGVEY